ncbi:GC-rich sequence DNA-binding factor-like protein [Striga hermonthica]|uniref:GC-rich sequence DNA-binding factor-like protein n=1 Tax=Striga hermonthica TaxID=68872 RepID=A0A9N7RAC0_STRHE|nr:GC-rich sequence DNA-binding factor-like protein [Striga hermonthica]
MSSAKSRNFRRRADDDEDPDNSISGTPSTTNKPSAPTKPKKPTPRPATKTLLSFADDEDDESPFSRPPPSKSSASSSSRFSKTSSAHKLTSSKDRSTPHPPISTVPSNVQPQAGVYTKEALLELQKNTKTLGAPSRNKPKPPEPEPVVVLKGLIKPVNSTGLDSVATGKSPDLGENKMDIDDNRKSSVAVRDDVPSLSKSIKLGPGLLEDDEEMPDQSMIEAIKAKRERLRQAKAAAPDFIALDGGSNHGEAEGLSDEEPEFRGRIGFFGEKIGGHDKKGVFDDFEERPVQKERGVEVASDEEDEEDKMWEEEQVRKGLGKRLDDGVGNQGVGVSVNGVSGNLPSLGYLGAGNSMTHIPAKNVDGISSHSSVGGTVVNIFDTDVMSISQQAELAKKALSENLKRVRESHGRTIMSLAKTEENLTSSLLNITTLENSLSAAGEKFLFMQKLREFVSVIYKASLLAEVIEHVKELKRQTSLIAESGPVPTEADELTVDDASGSDGQWLVRATICCEDRPDLLPGLINALKALNLKTLRAEITTLGGRVKNVLLITGEEEEEEEDEDRERVDRQHCMKSIQEALRSVMERSGGDYENGSSAGGAKRQRMNAGGVFEYRSF